MLTNGTSARSDACGPGGRRVLADGMDGAGVSWRMRDGPSRSGARSARSFVMPVGSQEGTPTDRKKG